MNAAVETVAVTCPGGATLTITKHSDGDISFLDTNGVRQGNATDAMVKLFATIKANGSGTPHALVQVNS